MTGLPASVEANSLPELVYRASQALAAAATAAEVLDAKKTASLAYDAAKAAARFAKAKGAHDELIAAAHRAQADALEIEAQAKRRLADEYDAAQERGEVAKLGTNQTEVGVPGGNTLATVADLGLTRKAVHEARQLRDAEAADPGVIRRTLDARLARGEEPTKAAVREAVSNVVSLKPRRAPQASFNPGEPEASSDESDQNPDFQADDALHRAEAFSGALRTIDFTEVSPADFMGLMAREDAKMRDLYHSRLLGAHRKIDIIIKGYDLYFQTDTEKRLAAEIAELSEQLKDSKKKLKAAKRDEAVQREIAQKATADRAAMLEKFEWEKSRADALEAKIRHMQGYGTFDLAKFAKIYTLRNRTDKAGERAVADSKMKAMAAAAGISIERAIALLSTQNQQVQRDAEDAAWGDIFEEVFGS